MLNVVTEVVQGTITLKLHKQYDDSVITTATKTLAAVMEGVVITSVSNAPLQSSLYNAGLVANETYSLKEELERITNEQFASLLGGTFGNDIIHFNEFEYFNSVTTFPAPTNFLANLIDITFPNSLTKISDYAFTYSKKLEIIKNSFNLVYIGYKAFEECGNLIDIEDLSKTSSIGTNAFAGCVKLNYLRFPNANQAPSLGTNVFGYSNSNYTGISASNKKIYLSLGAQGFNGGQWLDPLQNPEKCGFTIYGKLVINANNASAKFAITYTTVDGETKTINVNNGVSYLSDVQYETNMTIRVIEGGIPDEGVEKTFVYNDSNNTHTFTFTFMPQGSHIIIDQTVTDPATMISGDINSTVIQQIRAESHRYLGKYTSEGQMTLCQLSDEDSTKYADGTPAIVTGKEGDVFMKMPDFWYACSEINTDVWGLYFHYGSDSPGAGWIKWDTNTLIGVYEAYSENQKLYSRSGVGSSHKISQANFKIYARKRGNGFQIVDWQMHCVMAILFYAQYGHTNCQDKIGIGTNSSTKSCGATNNIGMKDTKGTYPVSGLNDDGANGNSQSINFWGLENWWGNKNEFIDNVIVNSYNWEITEPDGTIRTVGPAISTTNYITKMMFGNCCDLIPIGASGSSTTGFCDYYYATNASSRVVVRSYYISNVRGGISYLSTNDDSSFSYDNYGSRLAFRGQCVEAESVAAFKSLTAIG